ncbi:MAG: hypothetical protein IJM08_02385, partial [Firmicutes bacterium]|nr:hypothetical protein [Bacillota bacterium]
MKTIYYNGKLYTGGASLRNSDSKEPEFAEAFAVEDGVITAVGSTDDLMGYLRTQTNACSGDFRKIDLEGRFVCPGFNDSHMH